MKMNNEEYEILCERIKDVETKFQTRLENLRLDFSELVKAVKTGNLKYFGQGNSDMKMFNDKSELESFIKSLNL